MADRPDENLTLSEEKAARVFLRAAELDSAADSALSVSQVRQIAIEAGISARSIDLALEEVTVQAARVGQAAVDEVPLVQAAPAWVRFCMFGVSDRRIATGYYWLFVAGLVAFPLGSRLIGSPEPGLAALPVFGGMAFCTFALWSTSRAIRWLDIHGWGSLDKVGRRSSG